MKGFSSRRQELKVIEDRKNYGNIKEKDEGNSLLQFAAAISLSFSQMGLGAMISWSSPSLQYLMSEKSVIPITSNQGAWITSISGFCSVIGFLIIPVLMDKVGRKYTLLMLGIPQIISWLMIVLGKSVAVLYLARSICGLGYSNIGLVSIYIGEIAGIRYREMLSVLMVVSADFGMLMVATMGSCLSYHAMNLFLLPIPIIYFLSFIFMPESPYFYLMQGREIEALNSLMKLRGVKNPEIVRSEIERMKKMDEDQEASKNKWRELFCSERNRRGFIIVLLAQLTPMISGFLVVIAYAQQIFKYSEFPLTPAHSFIVLLAVKILSGLLTSKLIQYLSRRVLYITSGIFSAFALGFVGLSLFLKLHLEINMSFINWCPLAGLLLFEVTSSAMSSVPFVLVGELFPVGVKNLAVTLIFVGSSVTISVVELVFPITSKVLGIYVSFFIFAALCFTGTLFVFYIMPETKGRSLEEIQYLLSTKLNERNEVKLRLLSVNMNNYGV